MVCEDSKKTLTYELCVEPLTLVFNQLRKLSRIMKLTTGLLLATASVAVGSPTMEFTIGCTETLTQEQVTKKKKEQIVKYEAELIHTTSDYIKEILPELREARAEAQARGYKVTYLSVQLAQAIHESGSGKARITKKANNHFGIKASKEWLQAGKPYILATDDAPNEKFCKFISPSTSAFANLRLLNGERYVDKGVFTAKTPEAQLRSIKAGGYATNPRYVAMLMKTIKVLNLTKYDI